MRLLAFADHLSTASSGGAERVAAEVYARLAAGHDVQVTVLTALRRGHVPVRLPGVEVVAVEGTDLSKVTGAELLLARGLPRVARDLHAHVRPHVLHGNGLHFHGTAVAARLARATGTPLVTTAHLAGLSALGPLTRAAGSVWDATLGRYTVHASTGCVAVSDAVAAHLRTLGAPAAVTLAPNGVDHAVFHPRGRDRVGCAPTLRTVFVGRLISNKGPQVALEAVAAARDAGAGVTLTVLGDGPQRTRLTRWAHAHGLAGHVTFAGHLDDADEIAVRLRAHDVLLRPSLTEGLPLAVLEAMACGLPVICSDVPGNTEVVAHERNGLQVPARDPRAAGRALTSLAADRRRLARMSDAAVAVAATHTWDRAARAHLAALRAAVPDLVRMPADLEDLQRHARRHAP